jgi:uncharacterized protein (DUF58 family)
VLVALDTSRLMSVQVDGRTKLDHAVDAALGLALATLAHGDHVGVAAFDTSVHTLIAPRGSRRQLGSIVDALQPLEATASEAGYRALVRTIAARQRRRCLVILLTDFAEIDPETLVLPLRTLSKQHRVLVAALRDPVFRGLDATTVTGHASFSETGVELSRIRRLVLDDLATAREATLAGLRRSGISTIDATPDAVGTLLINRYLELRYGLER